MAFSRYTLPRAVIIHGALVLIYGYLINLCISYDLLLRDWQDYESLFMEAFVNWQEYNERLVRRRWFYLCTDFLDELSEEPRSMNMA